MNLLEYSLKLSLPMAVMMTSATSGKGALRVRQTKKIILVSFSGRLFIP
jgi:hypothetical protein